MADEVRLERTGGVAGLRLRAALALDALTAEEHAGLAALLAVDPGPAPGAADRFAYRVRVGDRQARVHEHEVPAAAQPLLERLEREGSLG